MKVKIYQLDERKGKKFMFRDYNYVIDKLGRVDIYNYNLVYECERKDSYNPNQAFIEFNCEHPYDFKGHSLSVSDIVELNNVKYYCNDFGWIKLGVI